MSIKTVNVCTHASLSEWLAEYICDSDMMNNYSSLMAFDGIDFGEASINACLEHPYFESQHGPSLSYYSLKTNNCSASKYILV